MPTANRLQLCSKHRCNHRPRHRHARSTRSGFLTHQREKNTHHFIGGGKHASAAEVRIKTKQSPRRRFCLHHLSMNMMELLGLCCGRHRFCTFSHVLALFQHANSQHLPTRRVVLSYPGTWMELLHFRSSLITMREMRFPNVDPDRREAKTSDVS